MKRNISVTILIITIGLFLVPILIKKLSKPELRSFQGVRLEQTSYQEIRFFNNMQEVQLAGLLFVPEGAGPFPAAVIIHGSGTSHRDNRWYLTLTKYLQDNGVVVLLPDKRGSELSEGDWRTASFHDLATDTVAAINYLNQQEEIAISQVGIIGMSQGGHIAPIVAEISNDVTFLVNVVGASVPMNELLYYEENHNLREMGILPGFSNLIAFPSTWMIRNVSQKEFWDAIGNFDPIPYWERLTIPSLVLYGEEDTNVPTQESTARLQALEKSNIIVNIYLESGHALEEPEVMGNSIFRKDALQDIVDFITSVSTEQ